MDARSEDGAYAPHRVYLYQVFKRRRVIPASCTIREMVREPFFFLEESKVKIVNKKIVNIISCQYGLGFTCRPLPSYSRS